MKLPDYGASYTDKEIRALERRINAVYKEAEADINRKMKDHIRKYKVKEKIHAQEVKDGKISQSDFDAWKRGQAFTGKQWQAKKDSICDTLYNANSTAQKILNGSTNKVFCTNANFIGYHIEKKAKANFGFGMYDNATVAKLLRDQPNLLPKPKVNKPKDVAWNQKKITRQITQGIIQGESLDEIADRLSEATGSDNRNAMLTHARTAMTSAQNAGRLYRMEQASKLGIKIKKKWIATLDAHTRPTHRKLDGQIAELDEPFKVDQYEIMYPADPFAAPAMVYNCRCTMEDYFPEYPNEFYDRYDNVDGKPIGNMTYFEWETAKALGENLTPWSTEKNNAQQNLKTAQEAMNAVGANKVYSGIWKNDVSYEDYDEKEGSIQSKEDYYDTQIQKLTDKQNTVGLESWEQAKLDQFKQYKKDLEEFKVQGKLYSDAKKNLKDAQDKLDSLLPKIPPTTTGQFAPNAWDDETKKLAKLFTDAEKADEYHRKYLDSIWDNLTDNQKYAVWEYTHNSNPINKSLSGYHDSFYRYDYIGMENTQWGHEDNWRYLSGEFAKFGKDGHADYHRTITNLTQAIEKSEMQDNLWLVRGSDKGGFAGLIEGDTFSFEEARDILDGDIQTMKDALIGQSVQGHFFISTGIARGTGFDDDVAYEIYAPKGTHGIYAEPKSYYGRTHSLEENVLYKVGDPYNSVGTEAEVILQRGTTYRITDIDESWGKIHVKMEIVDQPNYFKYGDEDTFNNGATRHKD